MAQSAEHWISKLGLVEHPGEEDGYFSVPFEATSRVIEIGFNQRWAEPPSTQTMFFKCRSTEMLFFHAGEPLTIYFLDEKSSDLSTKVLGLDVPSGQVPGLAVPGGTWFTRLVQSGDKNSAYSLFSCALAPGFDQRDFTARRLGELLSGNRE